MDHWGDPWADNADDKSPAKNAVTSPLPPSFTFSPVPVNGFVDDAGWGNNDDEFGDWASPPRVDAGDPALKDVESLVVRQGVPDIAGWSAVSHGETTGFPEEQWPEAVSNTSQDADRVDSEPSDSATISQLDESSRKDVDKESAGQMHPDVESSTRSSSSPSEISRNELSIESPRTSVEDERSAGATTKEIASQDDSVVSVERSTTEHTKLTVVDQVEEDDSASHSSDPAADFEESDVDRSSKNATKSKVVPGHLILNISTTL